MPEVDLHFATIGELGARYRMGEVSPVEVVDVFLDRLDRFGDRTKAYITVTADRARAEARAAEAMLRAGSDLGPLHGIPIALKDLFHTAGVRTTSGTKGWADFVPNDSAAVAKRLAQAGAILIGKTNMVELAFGPYGINPHYGTPPNPWDETRVPGGSSSGSGVAVAAGLATAALGTDTGGSVRMPASHCGIVGLKPTLARVSRAGVTPLSWTLDSVGPMARCVADAALVFEAIAGPDGADPVTLGQPEVDVVRRLNGNVRGMRVGLVRNPFFDGADGEVVAAVEKTASVLEGLGAWVGEMDFPEARAEMDEELAGRGSMLVMPVEGFASQRDFLRQHGAQMDGRIRERLEKGAAISAVDYAAALQQCAAMRQSAVATLSDVDAVVCPTMLTPPPRIADVGSAPARLTTRLVNFLGLCAISLPCGWTSKGLPIGLQLIGKPFDEVSILRLAHAYEQAAGWFGRRPPGY